MVPATVCGRCAMPPGVRISMIRPNSSGDIADSTRRWSVGGTPMNSFMRCWMRPSTKLIWTMTAAVASLARCFVGTCGKPC